MSSVNSYDFFTEFYNVSQKKETVKRYRNDFKSEKFLLKELVTDLHHLHAVCLNMSNRFLILNEPGKGHHERNWSILIYNLDRDNMLVLMDSFQVEDQSGYIGVSKDDRLVSVGVLKEDSINIYDIQNGDLLASIDGGRKTGFWGTLTFLPDVYNNTLLEFRVLSMNKGRPNESIVRFWDLGFRSADYGGDDDEQEVVIWERVKKGYVHHGVSGTDLLLATHADRINWLDSHTGDILRYMPLDKWSAKAILSRSMKYVAVSHIGHCTVRDVSSGEVVADIATPDASNDVFPLTPIAFLRNDSVLVLRVNQDMSLVLTLWQWPGSAVVSIGSVGGTISDDTFSISHDEATLVCWPYGVLEMYDMKAMVDALCHKYGQSVRQQLLLLRVLVQSERASVLNEEDALSRVLRNILVVESCDIFRMIVSFI